MGVTSFCIIRYDEELNIGYFEPIGTDVNHRRKGLGYARYMSGLPVMIGDHSIMPQVLIIV